jgi:hypothetical protein
LPNGRDSIRFPTPTCALAVLMPARSSLVAAGGPLEGPLAVRSRPLGVRSAVRAGGPLGGPLASDTGGVAEHRLLVEIAARLERACAHLEPESFAALVQRIAERKLRWTRRKADELLAAESAGRGVTDA